MANKPKTKSSSNGVRWSKRSRGWLNELVKSANTARDNSYMFIALIMLDQFGSLNESQLVKIVGGKHVGWFGKFSNTASETTKENVHAFLTSKGFDTFSMSYYGKIWSDVTKRSNVANLASKENGNTHYTYKVEAIIAQIVAGKMVISISDSTNANPVLVKGDGKNGTSTSKWYKQKKDGSYVTEKGTSTPKEFPPKFPTNPARCTSAQDVKLCREYWQGEVSKAQDNLDALKPMLVKKNGRATFKAYAKAA